MNVQRTRPLVRSRSNSAAENITSDSGPVLSEDGSSIFPEKLHDVMHFESGGRFIPFHLTPEPFIKEEAQNAGSTRLVLAMIMVCKSYSTQVLFLFFGVRVFFFFFFSFEADGS